MKQEKHPMTDETVKRASNGPRGWLAAAVQDVTDSYLKGELDETLDGKPLTAHRIAPLVAEATGITPSVGAVSAVLKRWKEYGFAKFGDKPFAFKDYTAAGRDKGLDGIIEARSEKRKKERAAAKKAAEAEAA